MAIPDYQAFMSPLLRAIADGQVWRLRDLVEKLGADFALTPDEMAELLPSGQGRTISSRVGWAKTYLKKAGLLAQPSRGVVVITDEGRKALAANPDGINADWLNRFEGYRDFIEASRPKGASESNTRETVDSDATPEEAIESSFRALQSALADDLLEQVKSCSPAFFERLVVELLVAMGYGGSIADAGKAVGKSGDGGIDGIIKEDKLGLDVVCIQAKRYTDNVVGRPAIQAFAGSMEPHRARKGVFLTTSSFSREALEYVQQAERRIVLIDGERLAELMIEHDIGVADYRQFNLKRLDSDYFEE